MKPPAGRYKVERAKDRKLLGYVTITMGSTSDAIISSLRKSEFIPKRVFAEPIIYSDTEMRVEGNNGVILYLTSFPR